MQDDNWEPAVGEYVRIIKNVFASSFQPRARIESILKDDYILVSVAMIFKKNEIERE